jgi:hypothetical protein
VTGIDLDRLLRLRLVVARYGEMDLAKWWNTKGLLGRHGAMVLGRGLPRTHYFAQARLAFAVARSRSAEVFDPPGCMTLWALPPDIQDQFEERWQAWLDDSDRWGPFFDALQAVSGTHLCAVLGEFSLVSDRDVEAVGKLRRSAEGRAVQLPGTHMPSDDVITMLAAGFARGEPGSPAIPYARLGS